MKTIHKYVIPYNTGSVEVEDSITKILTAQMQRGQVSVWAEVDTELPKSKYRFASFGTGWDLSKVIHRYTYISTVQEASGALIWHVYYQKINEDQK